MWEVVTGASLWEDQNEVILFVHFMYINAYFEIIDMKASIDKNPKSEFLQTSHVYHDWTLISHHKNFLFSKQKKWKGAVFTGLEII